MEGKIMVVNMHLITRPVPGLLTGVRCVDARPITVRRDVLQLLWSHLMDLSKLPEAGLYRTHVNVVLPRHVAGFPNGKIQVIRKVDEYLIGFGAELGKIMTPDEMAYVSALVNSNFPSLLEVEASIAARSSVSRAILEAVEASQRKNENHALFEIQALLKDG
jgi:hypothetical protein